MSPRSLAAALLLLFLFAAAACPSARAATTTSSKDEEEDLQYLMDNAGDTDPEEGWLPDPEGGGGGDDDDEEDDLLFKDEDEDQQPEIDETHVVLLTAANFSSFLAATRHVMVEFYAPWCGHCQALAPDYAAAASHLAAQGDVALAKVDATEDTDLAQQYDVQGFPTMLFFIDGVPKDYNGARTKDAIVDWINKKLGPGVENITTIEDAERILTGDDKAVLAFLDSLSVCSTQFYTKKLSAQAQLYSTSPKPDAINDAAHSTMLVFLSNNKLLLLLFRFLKTEPLFSLPNQLLIQHIPNLNKGITAVFLMLVFFLTPLMAAT